MDKTEVIEIFKEFRAAPKLVYLVGGAARDFLMNRQINDIDIASAAHPDEITAWAVSNGWTAIPTGIEHGTVTLIKNGVKVEHTTFRRDVSCDGRRATVSFSEDIVEDLSRRDFTINAIAISQDWHIIDPYDGKSDIAERTIRCVGEPADRFEEDLLRPIRAIRFSSILGFPISMDTWNEIIKVATKIKDHVSFERIREEFEKTIGSSSIFLSSLSSSRILESLIPEFNGHDKVMHKINDFHDGESNIDHTFQVANRAETPTEFWAALCHDLGKKYTDKGNGTFYGHGEAGVADTASVCDRFKLSNKVREFVLCNTEHHMRIHLAKDLKPEAAARLVDAYHGRIDEAMEFAWKQDQLNSKAPHSGRQNLLDLRDKNMLKPDPVITGDDVLSFGIKEGPGVGHKLSEAYRLQLRGRTREEIISKLFRRQNVQILS